MTISPSKLFSTGLLSLAFLFSNSVFAAPGPLTAVIDSPEQAIVGQVAFDGGQSHGTQLSYEWDFNDGTAIVSGVNVNNNYPNVGEYKVTLTVKTQIGEIASTTKIITILAIDPVAPKAKFTIDTTPSDPATGNFEVGQQITFTSVDNGTVNNNWDFGEVGNQQAARQNLKFKQSSILFGDGTKVLTTVTRPFLAPGIFTITLASQTNFTVDTSAATAGALTGTYQKTITVDPCVQGAPNCPKIGPGGPIEQIYEDNCARCHGVVDRTYPNGDKTQPPTYLNTIVKGEHSFLAGRGPSSTPPPSKVTAALILGAYSNVIKDPTTQKDVKLMDGVYVLTQTEATDMATYLAGLTLRTNQTGAELYRAQCSRCHGTGTGGYGVPVLGATFNAIKDAITNSVAEMKTIPATDSEITKMVAFLAQGGGAPLPKPSTGNGLYIMYCSYCHGQDGIGGPFVDDSIANVGVTGTIIMNEIGKNDPKNKMDKLQRLLDKGLLLPSDLDMIAIALETLNANGTPRTDEDED